MFNDKQPGYQRLSSIIAERTNRIVVWLGSGLSIPAGLPSWAELKKILCTTLINKGSAAGPKEEEEAEKQANMICAENNWIAFQRLKKQLGHTTYRAAVREAFKTAETCAIPENYSSILALPVTGILSLNLDKLATRAYTNKNPGKSIVEFGGFKAGEHLHVLQGAAPFIVNLHGTLSDESSWVLAHGELQALLTHEGYSTFIRTCLCSKTIVFVGISPDDTAVGGHLDHLSGADIDFGDHFWITDRTDTETEAWAERTQLQLIRYRNQDNDHSELKEILTSLGNYQPKEETADPVVMVCTTDDNDLPSPHDLEKEGDPEKIRELLNAHAVHLLKPNSESDEIDYEKYERFCKEYDEAIYRAWYVGSIYPRNKILGYTLENEITDGAFGRVFRARDEKGKAVAVKLLREEIRRKPEMLQSFRRGVRSMRILDRRKVKGMIPYEEASEIPAVVVMEFVEGPNLQEAVMSGYCKEWTSVLDISVQLANTIRRAHLLPERVLHRDLRPPNIMLKDYYAEPEVLKVVVLDFDLSWHLGAQELSVVNRSSLGGFLAPEQVMNDSGMSTRSAAVDSFGIGMTLYYLRTGQEPYYLQHMHGTWKKDLLQAILTYPCDTWQSVPVRFSRIIFNSTLHNQSERWDMGQIEGELELLKESILNPTEVRSAELLCEELAQRVVNAGGYPLYDWDLDKQCASLSLLSGIAFRLIPDESAQSVTMQMEWSNQGDRPYKSVRKYLKTAMDNSISSLQARGWEILSGTDLTCSSARFSVNMGVKELATHLQRQTEEISTALNRFKF